ncbi:MAG: cyclic beta 1-2 glucan synthetase, partial [Verrucomicrobia bacterium]
VLCGITFSLGVSQLAVALWNWLATLLLKPQLLPRLGYSPGGIAPESRGMVVVPTILRSAEGIDHLLQTLEIHHLANRDPHLHFALLTDWPDAAEENLREDAPLLERAKAGIESLNRKYAGGRRDLFFLFHRPRRWNASEDVWMGYERKRGKLMQFNAFLRGRCAECFDAVVGDQSILREIKYIVAVDTDTQLPRESARQLIGTMAHPLNRPQFDSGRGIVTEGYGLLQPRVDVSLPTADRSRFVRLHAGEVGIDPYTRTVSDVYQDLFGEGSFIGKGVYDVDAFQRALAGRFPENRILSHDLLESVYARCGLVSDVILYEEYPSRYEIDTVRRHRWIRGDWQILPWLLPRVPNAEGRGIRNPISALSWWKISDNLRRSLVPLALVLFFLASWVLIPRLGLLATGDLLAIVALPGLLSLGVELLRKPEQLPWPMHLRGMLASTKRTLSQIGLTLAFLPNDAFLSLTAIGRTLWRVFITRRHLLEWVTSSEVARSERTDLAGSYTAMWFGPAIALVGAVSLGLMQPAHWAVALPFFVLWLVAPSIAWWISLPIEQPAPKLSVEQLTLLHRIARKTWHFFETFVTAEENWLPPDNFQEEPTPTVAARTSPTNIGLSLLANLAARDFGYLSLGRLLARTHATIDTLHRLERHRGHFYNWYETRTLRPLIPLYVSSVDSGNLAGHLLTLASGLRGLAEEKILDPQIFAGLRDTLALVQGLTGENALLSQLDAELAKTPSDLRAAATLLQRAVEQSAKISDALANRDGDLKAWAQTLQRSCVEHLDELNFHAPWLKDENLTSRIAQLHAAPSLREIASFDQLDGQFPTGSEILGEASKRARERMRALETLAGQCDELAGMDFSFLFDKARNLFAVGFNVTEGRRDLSFYDLLASEARLCSYLAIAEGQVPQDHWFALGRLLVAPSGEPILVSWIGSMFEYLMPLLVMPNYRGTLLDRACKTAVELQIEYGNSRGVPWGVSESGFNQGDVKQTYQYRAFGVPGLGLKRGLAEDLVIAPYATVLALMVAPREASENLQRLARDGREGDFGFYEAVDYTPSRLPPDESSATVRSYMAHHQGMSLLALVSSLRELPMQRRFMSRPLLKTADLLLQERLPKTEASVLPEDLELEETRLRFGEGEDVMRVFKGPTSRTPEIHLLSNGRYHVAISNAGGGYSRWKDLAITRWREDATCDYWGAFIYLRDVTTGEFWSAAYQPTLRATKNYAAIFTQARAEFRQRHGNLEIHTELSVSPEDDIELRRVTLTNHSSTERTIELTSYAEVVLATQAADETHPAFSNLFVQTEFVPDSSAILCTRRARTAEEKPPW